MVQSDADRTTTLQAAMELAWLLHSTNVLYYISPKPVPQNDVR